MFKSESLSHQINAIRLITRILRYGLVALTMKRIKKQESVIQPGKKYRTIPTLAKGFMLPLNFSSMVLLARYLSNDSTMILPI